MLQTVPLPCVGIGGRVLRGLLETDIDLLGGGFPFVAIRGSPCRLDDVLGLGGTSTVFRASLEGSPVAVKVLLNARWARESFISEQQALKRLTYHGVQGVPRIAIDVDDGQSVLVTFPVGTPLVATSDSVHEALRAWRDTGSCGNAPILCAGLLRGVLDAMKQCHAAGVIHGDPRLSNIVVVESLAQAPSAVLIDFGSAILAPLPAAGAARSPTFLPRSPDVWVSLPYAPPAQLEAFSRSSWYTPEPWHDLFMLATSLYRLFVPWAPSADDARLALTLAMYWEKLMAPVIAPRPTGDSLGTAGGGAAAADISDAGGAGLPDSKNAGRLTPIRSPWGALLYAATAYDVAGFENAARVAVLSSVPDWPW